ncbi:MAG TPA: S9 family peptidase [Terriglobales bacterium]|nr:S9 family peptidase [Terriglobales bacterium]
MKSRTLVSLLLLSTLSFAQKPKLTLDDLFNSVSFNSVDLSPDGHSIVIGTERADWDQEIFRKQLWIYRDSSGTLAPLTQSGHDSSPQWSPDGRWIAFLSDRKVDASASDDKEKDEQPEQLYLIAPDGGEPFAITEGSEGVHAFAWASDSRTLFFATRTPWTKAQKDDYKNEWKDVSQYRAAERGDMIFILDLAAAIARHAQSGTQATKKEDKDSGSTPGSKSVASSPWRIQQMVVSPDGRKLAFVTESISERQEKINEFEIYTIETSGSSQSPRQLTRNEAVEHSAYWSKDSKRIFFLTELGSVEGKYKDTQPHLYWVDASSGEVQRWAADFEGSANHYAVDPAGIVLVNGRVGTEVQNYSQQSPGARFIRQSGWPGTYESIATALHSPRIAFVYSSTENPTEVYFADSFDRLQQARPITSFNRWFTDRDLPKAKPYRWTADDGTVVEGMLMYPPGKFEARNLPMFVFIHGGPADADGNHFEGDWYQWDRLAATQGWLVFEPNYRGSSGYGDKFLAGIVPEIVSRPGKDILEGVEALVKDGMADPNRLAVGGYSYGGYMTNWLITQTTRFKAAVTGAGAVEHVSNWGNDDTTFDDAYFLGGLPWEAQQRYHDEAAIFQIEKVRTPTHIAAGSDDIRVAVGENYLLDHALHALGVPSTLLIFPGEGHSLSKNPWHGKIKVREELKWLQKYGGVGN